jgi:hypothetical protein
MVAAVSFLAARYDEGWGDTLPVSKIDRLARSTSDLYRKCAGADVMQMAVLGCVVWVYIF